jgi:hypothetical protein
MQNSNKGRRNSQFSKYLNAPREIQIIRIREAEFRMRHTKFKLSGSHGIQNDLRGEFKILPAGFNPVYIGTSTGDSRKNQFNEYLIT